MSGWICTHQRVGKGGGTVLAGGQAILHAPFVLEDEQRLTDRVMGETGKEALLKKEGGWETGETGDLP